MTSIIWINMKFIEGLFAAFALALISVIIGVLFESTLTGVARELGFDRTGHRTSHRTSQAAVPINLQRDGVVDDLDDRPPRAGRPTRVPR